MRSSSGSRGCGRGRLVIFPGPCATVRPFFRESLGQSLLLVAPRPSPSLHSAHHGHTTPGIVSTRGRPPLIDTLASSRGASHRHRCAVFSLRPRMSPPSLPSFPPPLTDTLSSLMAPYIASPALSLSIRRIVAPPHLRTAGICIPSGGRPIDGSRC